MMDNYVGKRLDGRYEIQEIIGVGGMAVVYKAYDNIDDRIVAIKILKEEFLANEEFRRRFKNESKAIAVLSHPNIVKVYDVSFGDKLQYIVMEYIDGITLKEYIEQQNGLRWKEAVHFTCQILKALQHAHDKGIVHRDVKPQNIILLQNGNIKVTDFGIARFSRSDTRTMTEKAIGSVHYISPEQARGEVTDEKADIYSVGVMMYEMLTGQLPFQSDSAVSVAIMQLQADPRRPRDLNPQIPMGLEQITMRAMQKNPMERYQSAAEMLRDLDAFCRNPNIIFDYSYFVDNQPTRYVDRDLIQQNTAYAAPRPPRQQPVQPRHEVEEEFYEDDEEPSKNKTVQILTGVAIAAVIALIVFVAIIFGGNLFGGGKATVKCPDLIGKVYDMIKDDAEYGGKFKIVVEKEEASSEYPEGQIIDQNPKKDRMIKEGSTISVVVSAGADTEPVPDVYNKTLRDAKAELIAAGFEVAEQEVASKDVAKGYVIKTVPEKDQQAAIGSTITIYVSKGELEDAVPVPNVLNLTKEKAKEVLEKNGLRLGEATPVSSDQPEGIVLSQDPKDVEVEKGSAVNITYSNGDGVKQEVTVTITLPLAGSAGSYENGKLQVFIDDVEMTEAASTVRLSGASKTLTISGSGSGAYVEITVDNNTIYTATINFKNKRIASEKVVPLVKIPELTGKNITDVKNQYGTLVEIIVDERESNEPAGIVVNQSPRSGFIGKGAELKLIVSKGLPTTTTTQAATTTTTQAVQEEQ